MPSIDGASSAFNAAHAARVNGDYTGTTDEILQWGACKWGFDEELVRAKAWTESAWYQSWIGDAGTSCGVMQVRNLYHEEATDRGACESTAMNVDYALAWQRACFEGAFSHWMPNYTDGIHVYAPGDLEGCVRAWYSGNWRWSSSNGYWSTWSSSITGNLAAKPWTALLP